MSVKNANISILNRKPYNCITPNATYKNEIIYLNIMGAN